MSSKRLSQQPGRRSAVAATVTLPCWEYKASVLGTTVGIGCIPLLLFPPHFGLRAGTAQKGKPVVSWILLTCSVITFDFPYGVHVTG